LIEAIQACLTGVGIVVGGGWALWRFVLQREGRAKIQFDLDVRILGRQADRLLVEAVAIVGNKGRVRHYLRDFRFDLHYLSKESKVEDGDESINHQVLFAPAVKKRYWIPPSWLDTFIDAGVEQTYRYVTSVPCDATFLLLYAQFKYPDAESEFHTAQKVFPVVGAKGTTNDG